MNAPRWAVALAVVTLVALSPRPVSAAEVPSPTGILSQRACAYRAQYNQVRNGQTRATVTRILRHPGTRIAYHVQPRLPYWLIFETRKYPVCNKRTAFILVYYLNGRVRAKVARW